MDMDAVILLFRLITATVVLLILVIPFCKITPSREFISNEEVNGDIAMIANLFRSLTVFRERIEIGDIDDDAMLEGHHRHALQWHMANQENLRRDVTRLLYRLNEGLHYDILSCEAS